MGTSRHIGIVLACLLLQSFSSNGDVVHQHGPVLEGANVTLTCSGTTESEDRYVTWRTEKAPENSHGITKCNFSTRICESPPSRRYIAGINISNNTFSSSITILNVTSEDQHTIFKCEVYNYKGAQLITEELWNLSKVYYAPDELACNASLYDNVFINLTCVTPKVYPGIQCEFVQLLNRHNLSKVVSEDLVRDNNPKGDSRYNPALCSVTLRVKVPGDYRYYITIYPGLSSSDRFLKGLQYRQAHINVDENMGVMVEKDSRISCPERDKPIRIYCKSYWLGVRPSVQWITKSFHEEVIPELIGDYYQSSIDLFDSDLPEDKLVKCKVRYEDEYIKLPITVSIAVDVHWPPSQPPIFSHNGKNITGLNQIFDEGEITGTFVCTIEGGKPDVKSVTVICNVSGGQVIMNITGNYSVNFVSFNLPNSKRNEGVTCSCYGEYETTCYNATTRLVGLVVSEQSAASQPNKSIVIIFYIVAGTIGVLFLIVILGLVMFLYSRWRDLYSYIEVYFRFHETNQRKPRNNQESEHSYEPINTFYSGFSSSHRVWAQPWHENSSEGQLLSSHTVVASTETSCVLSLHESVCQNYANLLKEGGRTHVKKIFPQFRFPEQQIFFNGRDVFDISRSRMSPYHTQLSDNSMSFNNPDLSCENNVYSLTPSSRNISFGTESTLSLNSSSHYTLSDSEVEYQSSSTCEKEEEDEEEEEEEEEDETYFAQSLPALPPKPCFRRADSNNDVAPFKGTSSIAAQPPKPHRFGRSISSPDGKHKKQHLRKSTLFSLTTWESQPNQQRQPRKQFGNEVGIYCNLQQEKRAIVGRYNNVKISPPREPPVSERTLTQATLLSQEAIKKRKVEGDKKLASLLLENITKPPVSERALVIATLRNEGTRKPPVTDKHVNTVNSLYSGRIIKPSVGGTIQDPSTHRHDNFKKPPVPEKPTNLSTLPSGRNRRLPVAVPVLGAGTSDHERFRTAPAGTLEDNLLTSKYKSLS